MSDLDQNLKAEFQDSEYRYAYAESFLNTKLATQIKTLREQRGETQARVAELMGIKQPGYRRYEDVNHSVWKTDTLWDIARAYGVRLNVSFETFGSLLDDKKRFTKEALQRPKFEDDPAFNEASKSGTEEIAAMTPPVTELPQPAFTPRLSDLISAVVDQNEEFKKAWATTVDLSPIISALASQQESLRMAMSGIAESMKPAIECLELQNKAFRDVCSDIAATVNFNPNVLLSDAANITARNVNSYLAAMEQTVGTIAAPPVPGSQRGQVISIDTGRSRGRFGRSRTSRSLRTRMAG